MNELVKQLYGEDWGKASERVKELVEDKKHKPPVGESGCVSRDCAAKRKQAEAVIEFV